MVYSPKPTTCLLTIKESQFKRLQGDERRKAFPFSPGWVGIPGPTYDAPEGRVFNRE